MKPEQAHKLATACLTAVRIKGPVSAPDVFEFIKGDRELARDVPVTLPTVSRSLRSLFKHRWVRLRRVASVTLYFTPDQDEKPSQEVKSGAES